MCLWWKFILIFLYPSKLLRHPQLKPKYSKLLLFKIAGRFIFIRTHLVSSADALLHHPGLIQPDYLFSFILCCDRYRDHWKPVNARSSLCFGTVPFAQFWFLPSTSHMTWWEYLSFYQWRHFNGYVRKAILQRFLTLTIKTSKSGWCVYK